MNDSLKLDRSILQKIADKAIELINEQIEEGVDYDGEKYEYSSKPFARPVYGIPNFKIFKKTAIREGKLKLFTTKKGSLWALFTGGYKEFRELTKRSPNSDFLNYTGRMLASMTSKVQNNQIVVSFSTPQAEKKAFFLNISGVGKSRKLWKFLGLTKENEKILLEYAESLISQNLNLENSFPGAFKL